MTTEPDLNELLPWSHPFLMVDRMVRCVPHETAVTCKLVTAGDALAEGSGEGGLCFPSVLVLEGLSQTAALLFRLSYGPEALSGPPMLGFLKAKFRASARPGDTLTYSVAAVKMTRRNGVFKGVAHVDTSRIAAAELAFGIQAP